MSATDLAALLDELGRRLGPAGQHVFELAIRQVYINAITAVVAVGLLLVVGVVSVPIAERWRTAENADSAGGRDFVLLLPGVFYIGALVMALTWVVSTVPAVLNPEYAAIQDILRSIGGVK
jgi:hypothetical protein